MPAEAEPSAGRVRALQCSNLYGRAAPDKARRNLGMIENKKCTPKLNLRRAESVLYNVRTYLVGLRPTKPAGI
jgi:hypothetical protein